MIDGLRVTMSGEHLRARIEQRATEHQAQAAHWKSEVGGPLMPDHICETEAARSEWRAERLLFLRDHLEPSEVYRLGEMDLEFAELLPEEPAMQGPDHSDEIGPDARRICDSPEVIEIRKPDHAV